MNRPFRLVALLALTLATACASATHSTYRLSPSPLDAAVEGRTRTVKLYFQFDTILILDGILVDGTLRTLWVDQTAAAKRLPAEEAETMRAEETKADGESVSLILALYTADAEWNDLSGNTPLWGITLDGEKGPVSPSLIRQVSLDTLRYRDHLPFNPSFRKFYLVDFPRSEGITLPLTLTLGSALGEATLTWP